MNFDSTSIENIFSGMLAVGIVLLVIMYFLVITIYVIQAIILTKLNKKMYGKGSALAWIPFANLYLLGKLTVNEIVGWILVVSNFVFNDEKYYNLKFLVILLFYVYAVIKYFQLKNAEKQESIPTMGISADSNQQNDNKFMKPEQSAPKETVEEKPKVYSTRPMEVPDEEKNLKPSQITAVNPAKRANMQSNPLQDLYGSNKKQD